MSGRLWRPAASAPKWLALALHPLGSNARDSEVDATARSCAAGGIALAAIDLPLHGERHNAKLSRRAVAAALAGDGSPDRALWRGLVQQSARDLSRALDTLTSAGGLAAARIAEVSFAGAEPIALAHAAADPRVAAIFAFGPGEAPAGERPGTAKTVARLARPADLVRALARL